MEVVSSNLLIVKVVKAVLKAEEYQYEITELSTTLRRCQCNLFYINPCFILIKLQETSRNFRDPQKRKCQQL